MKIKLLVACLLIVSAFLAGRWYLDNPSSPPADSAIAGVGLRTQPPPTVKERLTELQSAQKKPVAAAFRQTFSGLPEFAPTPHDAGQI